MKLATITGAAFLGLVAFAASDIIAAAGITWAMMLLGLGSIGAVAFGARRPAPVKIRA
jgi:hypothetical protein